MAREANKATQSKSSSGQLDSSDQTKAGAPSSAKKFAGKARDLESLRDAVVDAASVGAGLWLSYLFVFFYLFVATAAVTHKDLFFENPVKLPFLNVELPLLGFFWLGPLLFLILHAYVLLHFALLADKAGVFHTELVTQIKDRDTRRRLRRQLPSNIFVQYLAGPRDVRDSVMGVMLRAIAIITLVIFPIALLVFFQLQFLPYHDAWITWWQRIAVLLDILLLWTLWPSIAQGKTTWISWRDFSKGRVIALALLGAVPLLLVFTIATFPGEWLETALPSIRLVPTQWPAFEPTNVKTAEANTNDNDRKSKSQSSQGNAQKGDQHWSLSDIVASMEWSSLHDLLVAGEVDWVSRKPKSLWSNRLVLPRLEINDTVSLRGRHLEGIVLIGTTLRKADFTGAQLQGAELGFSDLREAQFWCGVFEKTETCTQLQGASLDDAQLQDARLEQAQLQGASLDDAQLQGASLDTAQLQGASLYGAQLQGASLDHAVLHHAFLNEAQLQGAWLDNARLQDAKLADAKLQGASLDGAHLEQAWLQRAQLQGASLDSANLKGAILNEAQLQSADIGSAMLDGAQLGDANLEDTWPDHVPSRETYEQNLRRVFHDTGCVPNGAPYVIHGLLRTLKDRFRGKAELVKLASDFLDEASCPGAIGLSEEERAKLRKIRDSVSKASQSSPTSPTDATTPAQP